MSDDIAIQDNFREMLRQSLELLSEVTYGAPGWLERLGEMSGAYPGGAGDGGSSKGTHSDPTGAAQGKRDPGLAERRIAEKLMRRVYRDVLELHGEWDRNRAPRLTRVDMGDPGCEPCTSLPVELPNGAPGYPMHYCPTHTSPDISERTVSKKGKVIETVREKVRLCSSCYTFWRRNERLPTPYEVVDHVEGRRRARASA